MEPESLSITWNLMEELPLFTTRIFIADAFQEFMG